MLEGTQFAGDAAPHEVQSHRAAAMPKLLIIDDERSVRISLEMIASTAGWETFSCDQFADFPGLIRENAIDVIACDYRMPPVTGFDVLEQIQAAGLRTPAVMISACGPRIDARRAKELGVEEILPKPPNISAVRNALAQALRRSANDS